MKRKLNKCWFKTKEIRILLSLTLGKSASATFMSSQLSCYNFSSSNKLQIPLLIFLWFTYCKSEVES